MNARDASMNARQQRRSDQGKETTKGYPSLLKKRIRLCWGIM